MNVFLDTEFTDLLEPILISLGMVSQQGEEFYIEVPYPDQKCTAFVREAVLPLLGKDPRAICEQGQAKDRILTWLKSVRSDAGDVYVCVDYEADWELLCEALDYEPPHWLRRKMIRQNLDQILLYEFHIQTGLPQHHALHDAKANQYAYCPDTEEDNR